MRLIDADALLEETKRYVYQSDMTTTVAVGIAETWVKNAPTVGENGLSEWLEDSDPGQEYGTTWTCRECGHSLHEQHVWNPYDCKWRYCPWCGRRMDFVTNMPVDEPKTLNDLLRKKHWIIGV